LFSQQTLSPVLGYSIIFPNDSKNRDLRNLAFSRKTVSTTNLFHSEDFIWSYEFILLLVSVGVPVSSKTAKLYLRLSLETGAYN